MDRLTVYHPTKMELPFYRNTPPMSPNLEKYGITVSHRKGASQTEPIDYLGTKYNIVEVVRPKVGKFAKPSLTIYARMTYEEAKEMPKELELAGETYFLSHFFTFKCTV